MASERGVIPLKGIVLVVLVGLFAHLLFTFERRNLYFPSRTIEAAPQSFGLPFEEVSFETHDHVRLHGWFIPASQRPRAERVLLLSHGNAGNISHRIEKASLLRRLGVSIFLYDYRGFGKSEGTPSEKGTYADVEAAYRYLIHQRHIRPDHLIFYGESLGCAVAVEAARRYPSAGLILESAFTSTVDMAEILMPWLPARWIVRYSYDNLKKMSEIRVPLLILHSPADDIIPFKMGQALYEAARPPKVFVSLIGDHNRGYFESGEIYLNGIRTFLQSLESNDIASRSAVNHERRQSRVVNPSRSPKPEMLGFKTNIP